MVVTSAVVTGIYRHFRPNGQLFLSQSRTRELCPIVCGCEIRADATRIRCVVIVRITIVVDIGKIGGGNDLQELPQTFTVTHPFMVLRKRLSDCLNALIMANSA